MSFFFSRFGGKLQLLIPKRVRDFWQARWWVRKSQEYYYIKYAISVLRVMAWVVLVIGFIGSLVWGISVGGIWGGGRIVLGIVVSFLAWLLLIAVRELLKLFMDVREHTRNSAERVAATKKPR